MFMYISIHSIPVRSSLQKFLLNVSKDVYWLTDANLTKKKRSNFVKIVRICLHGFFYENFQENTENKTETYLAYGEDQAPD
jgi:hypothetical protein